MANRVEHMSISNEKKNEFSAEEFVQRLVKEAASIPCDETQANFGNNNLPPYYDEEKYKRGQAFFHKHIFSHFFCCMIGLTTVLTIPSILKILMLTKMSGSPMTAYRRYLATVLHMLTWYDSEFTPGSKLWKSVLDVKGRHNSASKKGCAAGLHRINQKDVAVTQFGFLGYAVIRSKYVGIHNATDEELHDFIHVWRVIGYLMGLEDKYNICRESVEETKQICELILTTMLKPEMEKKNEDFMNMSRYMIEGMWTMNQFLSHKAILCYVYKLMNVNEKRENRSDRQSFVKMNLGERIIFNLYCMAMYWLQSTPYRITLNYLQYLTIWLMQHFPFLAYYKFGYKNSHVAIINSSKDD